MRVDKIAAKEKGDLIECKEVYCVFDDTLTSLGNPVVKGCVVKASVVRHLRGRKVITFKYRPKARSRVKKGFKAEYTEIEITGIES